MLGPDIPDIPATYPTYLASATYPATYPCKIRYVAGILGMSEGMSGIRAISVLFEGLQYGGDDGDAV
jgi:hypothetical protein